VTMLRWASLVLVASTLALECQDGRLANCHCQSSIHASFELFCPSFQPDLQKLHIVVEPENFMKMTCSYDTSWVDIVTNIEGLQLGNIKTFKMINCPVPTDPFASMLSMMGVTNTSKLENLNFNLAPRGSGQLQGYHFGGLSGLIQLEIPRSNIKKVDKTFFEKLESLKSVDLTGNRGLVIDSDSFHTLTELQLFQCHGCYIKSLPEGLFQGLAKLRRISLHDNKLEELPLGIFADLISLEEVKLSKNELTSLPAGLFDTATNLSDLDIGFNRLESLPNKLFMKNTNFKRFTMIGNGRCQPYAGCIPGKDQRLELFPTVFQDSSVQEIRINHSPIKDIPVNLFKNCRKLVNLTIQHSLIYDLPVGLFSDTEKIKLIDFSGNKVNQLDSGLFQPLKEVESLRFIANNLTRLDANLLSSLRQLKTFHFHENHLFDLPKDLFSRNKKLKDIDLSHNNIHTWPQSSHVFEHIRNLDISNNKMVDIPQQFCLNMLNLNVLNMSHNLIGAKTLGKLDPHDLCFLNQGLIVDLSFNQLKSVELWKTNTFGSTNHTTKPYYHGFHLNLTGNPLACDCMATELKQKIEDTLDNEFKDLFTLSSKDLICDPDTNPPMVAGQMLKNVSFDNLLCPFPSTTFNFKCTDSCRCNFNRFHKESLVDCTDLAMSTFPTSLPVIEDKRSFTAPQLHTEKISLDMTGNQLHNLSQAVEGFTEKHTNLTRYQDITTLILTNNSMNYFSHACLPPRLALLNLDNNRLAKFTQADINFFDSLIKNTGLKLKLGGNPYKSTCDSRPLFNFIKNQGSKVGDLDLVEFKNGKKLWKIEKLEEFCRTGLSVAQIGVIVSILIILLIVILGLLVWTCYREHLTIWVYSKPYFRVLFTEDLIDQDKPYDVFLSYSHEDEDWVERTLCAGLEAPEEGADAMQYKCCIHTRDWAVGEMIPDQIVQSVESSRRTLIVLSKAYIESMWTKMEFQAAHTQALQDKTQRVILVVRDKSVIENKSKMEENLQRYISLNTYLDCEDPWFWQKLRYALPHRGGGWRRPRTRRETDRMQLMRSQAELELGKRSPSPRVLDPKSLPGLSPGPKGLTGAPRNGLVSPIQNGHANGHVANGHENGHVSNGHISNGHVSNRHMSNGHVGNQVVPA